MNSTGARKAALAMVNMHPADRRWMLARLRRIWRNTLTPLIREARRFVSFDAHALQAALDGQIDPEGVEVPTPAMLIAVLNTLPNDWAARVLIAVAPDHLEIYVAACGKQRGEAVRHEAERLPHPFPPALAIAMGRCLRDAGQVLQATEELR